MYFIIIFVIIAASISLIVIYDKFITNGKFEKYLIFITTMSSTFCGVFLAQHYTNATVERKEKNELRHILDACNFLVKTNNVETFFQYAEINKLDVAIDSLKYAYIKGTGEYVVAIPYITCSLWVNENYLPKKIDLDLANYTDLITKYCSWYGSNQLLIAYHDYQTTTDYICSVLREGKWRPDDLYINYIKSKLHLCALLEGESAYLKGMINEDIVCSYHLECYKLMDE